MMISLKLGMSSSDGLCVEVVAEDCVKLIDEKTGEETQKTKNNIDVKGEISGTIKIKDYHVLSSAYIDLKDLANSKNFVQLTINSDVETNLELKGKIEAPIICCQH